MVELSLPGGDHWVEDDSRYKLGSGGNFFRILYSVQTQFDCP